MNTLFTENKFKKSRSLEKLPCKCQQCGDTFLLEKRKIREALDPSNHRQGNFCSQQCAHDSRNKEISLPCASCGNKVTRKRKELNKSKSGRVFCNRSCSASYNNRHKKHGTRRSKLEAWLETQLTELFPSLKIDYNQSDTINSELDIYIPSLNLAFELNGIFHYEAIFGEAKLAQIQNNDERKFQACLEKKIELCIIDSSGLKYFKPKNAQKYLDIIQKIIISKSKN